MATMRKILRNSELNSSPRLERRPLNEVKPNPHYVRKPNREQRRKLEASFLKFGENAPILVDRHSFILAGHARYEALKAMGRTHVWGLVLDHLADAKARAYAIADNKIGEMSEWDQKNLATEISGLIEIAEDFEIEDTGFDTGEIDLILQGLDASDPDEQDEFEPRIGQEVSVLGDLWSLGPHRLFCGDARETGSYAGLMNGEKAAAVFSDPPFNVRVNGHITGKGVRVHREFPSASGEMTEAEFTEFLSLILNLLRDHSSAGALVWFWTATGWSSAGGVGVTKPPAHHCRRAISPMICGAPTTRASLCWLTGDTAIR
jgi:ParB-like nuclease domain